jgi:hypothetical protein
MQVARLDPALAVRVVSVRELRYTAAAAPDDDRPLHVRAASGLAVVPGPAGGRLAVIQDDASFLAFAAIAPAGEVSAIALPRGPGGRRRFEVALGNKRDKLDLEACVAADGELWAFGSGSSPAREQLAIVGAGAAAADVTAAVCLIDAAPLYASLRAAVGGALNLEGAALVADELWLLHRGNTGPADPGPAIARLPRAAFARWLSAGGPPPPLTSLTRFDLGAIRGVRLGFTDAAALAPAAPSGAGRVLYLACAEASPDAIDDGAILGSQLGVIDAAGVRAAPLCHGDRPLKAEGLALDPRDPRHAWIAIDPDDPDRPAELYEIELLGPW